MRRADVDNGDPRAFRTLNRSEMVDMTQLEFGETFGLTGWSRAESGDCSSARAAVRDASRSRMRAGASARRPHVEPDWREE